MTALMLALLSLPQVDPGWRAMARQVTIRRDEFGVPHIAGPTDASVAFGLMYAQAEDNFAQLEIDTAYAIGRASELGERRGASNDLRVRMFEVPRLAQEALRKSAPSFRRLCQAYADGLNFFLATHPEVHPAAIRRFEPWYFLANVDLPNSVDGVSLGQANFGPVDSGSNAWAIGPSKTTFGHAVLFSNPHVGLFGRGQRYECHLTSGEGWNFSGFAILGNPIPHAGHNERIGWTHTNTGADSADAYHEQIEGTRYRIGEHWYPVRNWKDTVAGREVTLRATSHGPLVGSTAIRFPVERLVRAWEQKLAMGKSRSLREFRRALGRTCLVGSNTTYADADGHIGFWYANAVPRRDAAFDWTKPVDGTDPRTEWKGFLSLDELPHVIDPRAGFVQNCNSDPWHTSAGDNPVPGDFPPYVVHDRDTARAANSRRILESSPRFSWADLQRLSFDSYVYTAAERVPLLLSTVGDDPELRGPVETLRSWDRRSSVHSISATLYFETELDLLAKGMGNRRQLGGSADDLAQALRRTVRRLTAEFGTWQVPWGLVNRVRKSPEGASLPVAGAPSVFGQIFAFGYPFRTGGIHYGTEGNTYVSLVSFGQRPEGLSLCGLGQSADPSSPHYFDQAGLYASGRFKRAWFAEEEVRDHVATSYHPGEEIAKLPLRSKSQ